MRALMFLPILLVPCIALAQIPEGWFPFAIGELADDSVANVSSYSNAIAGAKGFVEIRDGHFYEGDGNRIRFLATNLTFEEAFPGKELAPKIARRMASIGINCVRFHHMDAHFRPRGIWDPAYKDRQHIDAEQIDRLDWLIYQLKLNGIYSNLNLHVSRQFTAADGFDDPSGLPKYDKGVDNWQPRMIDLQHQYARELLTHENPYTKTRYADEPCVVMVEMNNENSALQFAYGSTFHELPEPYRGQLAGLWVNFLKDKYGTTEDLRKAWDEGSQPLGGELLRNAKFAEGTKEWTLESRSPGEDVFEVADDPQEGRVLHARLNKLGVNSWDFQIHQRGQTLQDGSVYTVSFKIKADPPRTVSVGARYDVADWRGVGLTASIPATEEWTTHELVFTAKEPMAEHTRLSFNCQNSLGSVWLADVSLKPGGIRGLDTDQSLEKGNIDFSTASSTRRAWSDWVEFFIALEREYTLNLHEMLKKDLGLKAHVVDTQASYGGLGGVLRESRLDYIDIHSYWQHPRFPGQPWDSNNWNIPNTPMTDARGNDTLTRLALHRVAGMPFTVSEYNHPAPNDYRAECMPMLATVAALQDWDGLFQFNYGTTPEDFSTAKISGYFQMVSDPAKVAFFPVAANLFIRGDLSPAREQTVLSVPEGQVVDLAAEHRNDVTGIWSKAGVQRVAALQRRLAMQFTQGGELAAAPQPSDDEQATDSSVCAPAEGQLFEWDSSEAGKFTVDTPKTVVALGRLAGTDVKFGAGVQVALGETETGWVAFALTSMDGLPIAQSRRMLLVLMSKVDNQEMGWDENRTTVKRAWGYGPPIAEGVGAKVKIGARDDLVAYPLDGSGTRGVCINGQEGELALGPQWKTAWYEISPAG